MKNNDKQLVSTIEIQNTLGLHARPSASFVRTATGFKSKILVEKNGEVVNGKSIMGLLMLSAGQGSKLTITADGPDADNAIKSLEFLINNKFGENS